MKEHKIVSAEVSDGILARVVHVRCSCGWSGGTFIEDNTPTKAIKKIVSTRFAGHVAGKRTGKSSSQCARNARPSGSCFK